MQSFKKHLTRSTQKIKRTVVTSHQYKDAEYDMLMNSIQSQEKQLTQFDKHVIELTKSLQTQVALIKNFSFDYKLIYANTGTTQDRSDDLEMVQELQRIADQQETNVVRPFIDKCQARIQQPIREYIQEINEATKGLSKQRHNKQLDFEYQRDKYNSVSSKTSSTPQQIDEARNIFETARLAFEEIDEQVKSLLREVAVKKYTVFHPLVSELFGELMAEYYEHTADMASLMRRLRMINAPEQVEQSMVMTRVESDSVELSRKSSFPPARPSSFTSTPLPPTTSIPKQFDVEWYWLDDAQETQGPVSIHELKNVKLRGLVNQDTFVCCDGMSEWKTANELGLYTYL
jgi:predicted  nucleic acid-binding Zn-ribbon protein